MMAMMAFAAIGPLPFSALFEMTGSFGLAIFVFLALPVLCAVLALLATRPAQPLSLKLRLDPAGPSRS